MAFSTFSGPIRSGTVREGATQNIGLAVLTRTAYVNLAGAALTATPPAQNLFILPAGAKILNFLAEVTVVPSGNGVTQIGVQIGRPGTVAAFAASFNTGIVVARVTQATIDTATASTVLAMDNVGLLDTQVQATFTATTGNPTAGQIAITVVYVQRLDNGAQIPVSA